MPDYGVKFPIVVPIGREFKKNGIIYEIEAQTTHSVLIKDKVTGKMKWEPIEAFGGNAGGWEIIG